MKNLPKTELVFEWDQIKTGDLFIVQNSSANYCAFAVENSNSKFIISCWNDIGTIGTRLLIKCLDIVTYVGGISDSPTDKTDKINFFVAVIHTKLGVIGMPRSYLSKLM